MRKRKDFKRVVALDELEEGWDGCYSDLIPIAQSFVHRVILDHHDTLRWKPDGIVCLVMGGNAPFYEGSDYRGDRTKIYRGKLCLNTLWEEFYNGAFTVEELMKFYMDMGYSLCGFCEVFGQRGAEEMNLEGAIPGVNEEGYYNQTVLEYMAEKWKNKIAI